MSLILLGRPKQPDPYLVIPWVPTEIPDLVAWLGADDGIVTSNDGTYDRVTSWTDKVNGLVATPVADNERPSVRGTVAGGVTPVRFADHGGGVTSRLYFESTALLEGIFANGGYVAAVYRQKSGGGSDYFLSMSGYFNLYFSDYLAPNTSLQLDVIFSGGVDTYFTFSRDIANDAINLIGAEVNSDRGAYPGLLYRNHEARLTSSSLASSGTIGDDSGQQLAVGGFSFSGVTSSGIDGELYELFIFTKRPTTAQMTLLETWVNTKYSIAMATTRTDAEVYGLFGQSNAKGRGALGDISSPLTDTMTNFKTYLEASDTFADLLAGSNNDAFDLSSIGLEIGFGNAFVELSELPRYLIKYAVDGTTLDGDWSSTDPGALWLNLLERVYKACRALRLLGIEPNLSDVLWSQGDSDANFESFANDYAANLNNFRNNLLSFVEGMGLTKNGFIFRTIELIKYDATLGFTNQNSSVLPYMGTVNAGLQASSDDFIVSTGYGVVDPIHYNASFLTEQGRRWAAAINGLTYEELLPLLS